MAIPASIRQFVESRGVHFTPIHHRAAFTAQQEAAAAHVPGLAWAKTVVCMADGKPVLAMLPAHYRVDLDALRAALGAREVRLATEPVFAGLYPECETGAMAPFGPLYGQPVYVEEALARDPDITFHAGTHVDAMRMRFSDFVNLVHPIPARIALRSH
ncbi:MAG: YbaK/EbsC family protein [Acidobacteria bacterium]|nr:YbaK/EbsC family protein [Acidobacteriota bacterium]